MNKAKIFAVVLAVNAVFDIGLLMYKFNNREIAPEMVGSKSKEKKSVGSEGQEKDLGRDN